MSASKAYKPVHGGYPDAKPRPAAVDGLIERLRNFEGSDALGNGDFSLMHEAADALEQAQEKARG